MSFIEPDEHIIILDYNCYYPSLDLHDNELARLKEAGIKTVMCYINWSLTEPTMGEYDWSLADERVNACHKAGLKAIVKTYLQAPPYFPDNWYIRSANLEIQRNIQPPNVNGSVPVSCLSYWNPEAWGYHLEFIEKVCKHFKDDRTLCINISPANGEALIPGNNFLFDEYALASFGQFTGIDIIPGVATPNTPTLDWLRETVIPQQVETQRIFSHYFGEYWTMLHHAFETIPSTGNWLIDDLYNELHKLDGEHWGICYTLYRPGEIRGLWGAEQDIKRHGIKMLIASEGPEGLITNTRDAMSKGARGMLTGPLAPYLNGGRMEEWMYNNIIESSKWWTE